LAQKIRDKSDAEVARLLRRSHFAGRTPKLRRAKKLVEWWDEKELKLLGRMADEDLARQLGRGIRSVRARREKLHIPVFAPAVRAWTRAELRLLGTRPDQQVADELGRTRHAVQGKRYSLGIPPFWEHRKTWLQRPC